MTYYRRQSRPGTIRYEAHRRLLTARKPRLGGTRPKFTRDTALFVVNGWGACERITDMRRQGSGPVRGKPQAHRRAYDPSTRLPWRTGVVLNPEAAAKAITAADSAGLSFAGLVNELVKRMKVDESGRPLWADELTHHEQEELPQTG